MIHVEKVTASDFRKHTENVAPHHAEGDRGSGVETLAPHTAGGELTGRPTNKMKQSLPCDRGETLRDSGLQSEHQAEKFRSCCILSEPRLALAAEPNSGPRYANRANRARKRGQGHETQGRGTPCVHAIQQLCSTEYTKRTEHISDGV